MGVWVYSVGMDLGEIALRGFGLVLSLSLGGLIYSSAESSEIARKKRIEEDGSALARQRRFERAGYGLARKLRGKSAVAGASHGGQSDQREYRVVAGEVIPGPDTGSER